MRRNGICKSGSATHQTKGTQTHTAVSNSSTDEVGPFFSENPPEIKERIVETWFLLQSSQYHP
jgi:hypothetical protein